VPSSSASTGVRYRERGQERRDHRYELKLSASEHTVLATAAGRDRLTLAAYLVRTGLDRAEHRTAPVGAVQREMVARLMELADFVSGIQTSLSQAATAPGPTGTCGPDLKYCMRVVRHIDEAVDLIRQRRLP
jgi:hypothetical protein